MEPIPFVIAEAGSTHEDSLENVYALIRVAAAAGCQVCKFQFWSTPWRMRERRHIAAPSTVYNTGSLRAEWLPLIKRECADAGILFGCSTYLPEDVAWVSQWADVLKTASFEARDTELTDRIAEVKGDRPWFISTGMQDEADNVPRPKGAIFLHCVSAYPCPLESANLGAIEAHEGYSDHTRCIFTGGLAVASGADYLEVHYRLDGTAPTCPDYVVALTPAQLTQYVEFARTAALARGTGDKRVQAVEQENLKYRVGVA